MTEKQGYREEGETREVRKGKQGKTQRWVSMWAVGRSGEDSGKIHRSKGIRCSGVLGEEESGGNEEGEGEEVIGVSRDKEEDEWEGVQREATKDVEEQGKRKHNTKLAHSSEPP